MTASCLIIPVDFFKFVGKDLKEKERDFVPVEFTYLPSFTSLLTATPERLGWDTNSEPGWSRSNIVPPLGYLKSKVSQMAFHNFRTSNQAARTPGLLRTKIVWIGLFDPVSIILSNPWCQQFCASGIDGGLEKHSKTSTSNVSTLLD